MIKLKFFVPVFLLLLTGLSSCNNDDDNKAPASASVNDFIWRAMNLWYYWQSEVPDLANNRFQSDADYQGFLKSKPANEFFYGLLYDYGNTDRFSWIVSDYRQLQNEFANLKFSFGMKYGLVYLNQSSDQIFGYVQYVMPNSPAEAAGLKRGDIFTQINGTQLNDSNYSQLLANTSATFGMGFIQDGQLYETGQQISLTKVEIRENPIYLTSVIEKDGHKIGYIVYNAFRANFNAELNNAVSQLKTAGITDLVIDLRYNGGGSVLTCSYFGSMLTGQFNNQLFTKINFNSKRQAYNSDYKFENQAKTYNDDLNETGSINLNHLNMNRIFVLTLSGTASASEMLINCLQPYIEVKTIGRKTYGKTVGSITLYDSPSEEYISSTNGINGSHTWAMQPIVFDSKNAQNMASSVNGIVPDTDVNELAYLENLPALGSENEPLLATAISQITGGGKPGVDFKPNRDFRSFKTSAELETFGTEMYLEKDLELK